MKFFADAMLGKLARWLRILGYDTAYERSIDDMVLAGRARSEGRLILTRDTGFAARLGEGEFVFIRDNATIDQLAQAVAELGLDRDYPGFLTRCVVCNARLEDADKDSVRGQVPEYTWHRSKEFRRCPGCGRVYWDGTHPGRILARLSKAGIELRRH